MSLAVLFGEPRTRAAFGSLLIPADLPLQQQIGLLQDLEHDGITQSIRNQASKGVIDNHGITNICRQAIEYANQGRAPVEPLGAERSINDREHRIRSLIEEVARLRLCSNALISLKYDYIWDAFDTRKALDGFGGKVPLKGLCVLASLRMAVIRTAVSRGHLRPDQGGMLEPEEALAWLVRRRQFCPSRWRSLADDQRPFDPKRVSVDTLDTVVVPKDFGGMLFVPESVMRSTRDGGFKVTISGRGAQTQLDDFHDALCQLAELEQTGDIPRWRRRNRAGKWGTVRARGAWIAVSKSDIARQLCRPFAPTRILLKETAYTFRLRSQIITPSVGPSRAGDDMLRRKSL